MKCYICGEEISKNHLGLHLKFCKKKHKLTGTLNEIKYKQLCYYYKIDLSEKFFITEYIENKKSVNNISKEYKIIYNHVIFFLNFFNIKRRTLKEECNSDVVKQKYIETVRKNYGVDNVSQSNIIKEKKKKTFLKNYGVDNIFKDKKFRKEIAKYNYAWTVPSEKENKLRIEKQTESITEFWYNPENKEYCEKIIKNNKRKFNIFINSLSEKELLKYNKSKGNWWNLLTDEEKTEHLKNRKQCISKLEIKVAEVLILLKIPFITQKFVNRTSYDFSLTNTRILIEVQGDFWHGNPLIYRKDDLIIQPRNLIKAQSLWQKDYIKRKNAEKYGYKVIYIWESEMKNLTNDELMQLIIFKLYNLKNEN